MMAVAKQTAQMFRRAGAAVGAKEHVGGELQGAAEQFVVLGDAGVAVAVTVEDVRGDGHGSEFVEGTEEPHPKHLVGSRVAMRDVGRAAILLAPGPVAVCISS